MEPVSHATCPEIVLRLVLSEVSVLLLEPQQAFSGKRLFYEWFVVVLWWFSGSEQSPQQAFFAKYSLLLAGFWKDFFAAEKLCLRIQR